VALHLLAVVRDSTMLIGVYASSSSIAFVVFETSAMSL